MELIGRIERCKGCKFESGDYCVHEGARQWYRGNFGSRILILPFLFQVAKCPLGKELENEEE